MIAFNELLDNINIYQTTYNQMGYKTDLNQFIILEQNRKNKQMLFEDLRSKTNKLCHELAVRKLHNEDINAIYLEIIKNEELIKNLENELNTYNNIINKKLKGLPNIPDEFISSNELISSNNKSITLESFFNFINGFNLKNIIVNNKKGNNINYTLKQISDNVFSNEDSSIKISTNNNLDFMLLFPEYKINEIFDNILNYLSINSLYLKKVKTKSISKSSTIEFLSKLNKSITLRIELKREFFTREYNIKYKNNKIDMTKFLNQINIKTTIKSINN